VSTSSAKRSNVSELGSLIKKMFEGQKTFGIMNDNIKRYDVHREKKFVLTKETEVAKNLSVLAVFNI